MNDHHWSEIHIIDVAMDYYYPSSLSSLHNLPEQLYAKVAMNDSMLVGDTHLYLLECFLYSNTSIYILMEAFLLRPLLADS